MRNTLIARGSVAEAETFVELGKRVELVTDEEAEHLLDLLSRPGLLEKLAARKFNELHRLAVVPYYGCLITRPPDVTGAKEPENPTAIPTVDEADPA